MSLEPSPQSEDPGAESIATLFQILESPLLGYAARLLGNAGEAQDVVQEAFLRLHRQLEQVRDRRSWLYRTVHNLSINHRRRERKIVSLPQVQSGDGTHTSDGEEAMDLQLLPDEEIVRLEGIGLVRSGLQNLDARSRDLIQLKFQEGLSYKQISERTQLTVGHVGYLLHHALKSLASEVAKAGLIP